MNAADRVLYHQVHPAKLTADIGSTVVAIPGAWWHWPLLIAGSILGVVFAWTYGLVRW
jgi:hypothetical protein